MKRIMLALTATMLIAGLSVSAFAATGDVEAQKTAREEMREQRGIVTQYREETRALSAENKTLETACKELKKQTELTAEQKVDLKEIKQSIAQEREILQSSKGQMKALALTAKEKKKAAEFEAATEAWREAAAIGETRMEAKEAIHTLLLEKQAILEGKS